ncbi:MAG: hypothetical protein AMJ43_07935 [Coxiella sp. DG_40]|nr:MAG: hypothetical protein AMJ43_07935 [Coxiella sp. DG_40]
MIIALTTILMFQHFDDVKYVKNYDGDTVTVNIPYENPIIGKEISIRLRNIDTPEMNSEDKCLKDKAKDSKMFVENILKTSKRIDLRNCTRGKYFRMVCDVFSDGNNIGVELIKNGFAKFYDGKRSRPKHECK